MGKIITDETGQQILQAIKAQDAILQGMQGTLSSLKTKNKTSLVASINDVYDAVASNTETIANHTTSIATLNSRTEPLTATSPYYRNSMARFKNLGTSISDAHRQAIKNHSFEDLHIGDNWTINGHTYWIAEFSGDFITMMSASLYQEKMNETDTNEGGYLNSYMFNTGLAQADEILTADWGDLRKTIVNEYFLNTNAAPNAFFSWVSRSTIPYNCMLPSFNQLFGGPFPLLPTYCYSLYRKKQLPLALYAGAMNDISGSYSKSFWLQDCGDASSKFLLSRIGGIDPARASTLQWVRVIFLVG